MADLRPNEHSNKGYVFGFIKIFYDGKDVTNNAKVQLSSGDVVTIGAKGFYAAAATASRWNRIKAIKLKYNGKDYDLPNLWIQSGPAGSRTYFGHLTVQITRSSTLQREDVEEWNWKVESNWKEAAIEWLHYFKQDKFKSYMSLGKRTGKDVPISRKLATDRQDIDFGF